MSETSNVETVKRGYEAFGRGDLNTLLSLFEEGIEWETPGPPELPTAGRRRGHQEVAGFFQTLSEMFNFDRFEPKEFIAQGERVVVIGDDSVRLKATDARIEFAWVHVFDFRNGKVARFREYGDTAPLVAALRAAQTVAR
jgi:ketosteroid isomerase-like protein